MKTRENLIKIAFMLKIMNEKLLNKNLKDYIFDKFECISDETFEIINITNNSIKTTGNKQNTFEIIFEPNIKNFSKITTIYTSDNERHKETKELIIDGEKITIEEKDTNIYINKEGEPISIKKVYDIYKYKNNNLIYSYNFTSSTGINDIVKNDGTTIEEAYIFPDNSAIKFMSTTAEKDYFGILGTRYLKTDNYGNHSFNTQNDPVRIKIFNFDEITELEYQTILNNWEQNIKQLKKQTR